MENEIVRFLARYGIWGALGVILAIVVTDLVKIPFKKWAEKQAAKNGVEKIVYTKWLFVLPVIIGGIAAVLNVWYVQGWGDSICKADFPWGNVVAECVAIAGTAGSLYAVIENFQQSNLSKKIASLTNIDSDEEVQEAKTVLATKAVSESVKQANAKAEAKAEAKAQALAEKKAKEIEKANEKARKIEEAKLAKIADLEKQIQTLKGVSSEATTSEAKDDTAESSTETEKSAEPWSK